MVGTFATKPEGKARMPDMIEKICIFGDSVSKGVVLDDASNKDVLLKDSFVNRVKTASGLLVRNFSRFGSTVTKGLAMLDRHRGELKDFDHVVLEFGGNDCDFIWPQVAQAPCAEHQPKTPLDVFKEEYARMLREIRNAGSHPIMLTLPPIDAERYLAWISQGISKENILCWLGDVDHIYRWHEMYNLAVVRLAGETHTPLVDITSPFLETKGYQKLLCGDGIHPNESGHQLISRILNENIFHYRESYAS